MSSSDARLAALELQLVRLRRRQWIFGVVAACAIVLACKDKAEPLTKLELGGVKLDSTGLTITEAGRKVWINAGGAEVSDGPSHAIYGAASTKLASANASATITTLLDAPRVELSAPQFYALVHADAHSADLTVSAGQVGQAPTEPDTGPHASISIAGGQDPIGYVTVRDAKNEATMSANNQIANVSATINGAATNLVGGAPTSSRTDKKHTKR